MTAATAKPLSILIIGGYGAVGRHIADHLSETAPDHREIVIAGRDATRAEAFAQELGPNAKSLKLDATDRSAVAAAVAKADIVILNTEAGNDVVSAACIDKVTPLVSVAASVSVLRALAACDFAAREVGVTFVKDVGLAPGLVQMLAIERLNVPNDRTSVDLFLELGIFGRHGPEAVAWTLDQAYRASQTEIVTAPAGTKRVIPAEFVDREAFAEKIGAGSVRSFLTLVPHWIIGPTRMVAPVLKKHAPLVHRASRLLTTILRALRVPTDQVRLGAQSVGPDGSHSVVLRAMDQSRMTGCLAAETALKLLRADTPAGVLHMSDVLKLRDLDQILTPFGAEIIKDSQRSDP